MVGLGELEIVCISSGQQRTEQQQHGKGADEHIQRNPNFSTSFTSWKYVGFNQFMYSKLFFGVSALTALIVGMSESEAKKGRKLTPC